MYAVNSLIDVNSSHRISHDSASESLITSVKKKTKKKRGDNYTREKTTEFEHVVWCNRIRTGPVRSGPIRSDPIRSDPGFANGPLKWLFSFCSRSLRVCLFSFKTHAVQEKFISKLVNSKVNFTRKTDIVLIISSFSSLRDSCDIGFYRKMHR